MRTANPILALVAMVALASCGPDGPREEVWVVNEVDPYLARALNDPLMVDPDLAYINEANAAITIGYDHALPSFQGSEEAASRARETARLELLEDGPIAELPAAKASTGPAALAERYGVEAVLATVGAPSECRAPIKGSFAYAASLPPIARIMPHGMVRVAAAVDQPDCTLRLVRYQTPASIEDALQYHYTMAERGGLKPVRFTAPEASLVADRRGAHWQIYARKGSGHLTSVDVITWSLK